MKTDLSMFPGGSTIMLFPAAPHTAPHVLALYVWSADTTVMHSPVWASRHECMAERASAKAAGQVPMVSQASPFYCRLCGLHIGPGYYAQAMYIIPLARETQIMVEDREKRLTRAQALPCCGDCHMRHQVPERLCVVQPEDWVTRALLDGDGLGSTRMVTTDEERIAIRLAVFTRIASLTALVQTTLAQAEQTNDRPHVAPRPRAKGGSSARSRSSLPHNDAA